MAKKIKVVWICHFSNEEVRSKLNLRMNLFERVARMVLHKEKDLKVSDTAQWITNGIQQFRGCDDVELHIVAPQRYLSAKTQNFEIDGIYYHLFKASSSNYLQHYIEGLKIASKRSFRSNRHKVLKLVNTINPNLIHVVGAENPYYSLSALDIDISKYPMLVSLQTLVNDPKFYLPSFSPMKKRKYAYLERLILERTPYISTGVAYYGDIVLSDINPKAHILKGSIFVGEDIDISPCMKEFDYVFFANNVSKGIDEALSAFVIVKSKRPDVTLNIIGSITDEERIRYSLFLKNNKCEDSVVISGRLPTHEDVLNQIKKAKAAIIPLKSDITSGTIREAMSRGVPVITTITVGTPLLNKERESVLLSEIGDIDAFADNMIRIIDSPEYAESIRQNAIITVNQRYSNKKIFENTIQVYHAVLDNYYKGTAISSNLYTINRI